MIDDLRYTDTGEKEKTKRYTFFLGKYGPFIERVPIDPFDPNEFGRRVAVLRAHVTQILS